MTEKDMEIQSLRRELKALKEAKISTLSVEKNDGIVIQFTENICTHEQMKTLYDWFRITYPDNAVICINDHIFIDSIEPEHLLSFLRSKGVNVQ